MRYEMYILPEELVAFRWLPQNANMSGRRPDSIKRRCWEYRHLLDNFLSIQDPAFFVQVFPEAQKHVRRSSGEAIAICPGSARLARRRHAGRRIRRFALDTMFRLLSDPQTAAAVRQERFDFDYKDFIKLTGECDVFNAFAGAADEIAASGASERFME